MQFRANKIRNLAQRLAALWLLLIVLSGIVPPVFASSASDFCPLTTKYAPIFEQNPDDPICDVRLYLKRNQPPKKPKTWWEKFWSNDNFPPSNSTQTTENDKLPRVSLQRDCCKLCCVSVSSNSGNQSHAKSLINFSSAEIRLSAQKISAVNFVRREDFRQTSFPKKSRPRAPPFFN